MRRAHCAPLCLTHPCFVYTVKFHPNNHYQLATGAFDGAVRLWCIQESEYTLSALESLECEDDRPQFEPPFISHSLSSILGLKSTIKEPILLQCVAATGSVAAATFHGQVLALCWMHCLVDYIGPNGPEQVFIFFWVQFFCSSRLISLSESFGLMLFLPPIFFFF